jgi:hypothetical protein
VADGGSFLGTRRAGGRIQILESGAISLVARSFASHPGYYFGYRLIGKLDGLILNELLAWEQEIVCANVSCINDF